MTTIMKWVSANPWQGGSMALNLQIQSAFPSDVAALAAMAWNANNMLFQTAAFNSRHDKG
jgi:hypothetical protein